MLQVHSMHQVLKNLQSSPLMELAKKFPAGLGLERTEK